MYRSNEGEQFRPIPDLGPKPSIIHIDRAASINQNFRTALFTGKHLQVTLMSIPVGESIGIERHDNLDQFIRVERGRAMVMMGYTPNNLREREQIDEGHAVIIPAGTWHNIENIGNSPLKLSSIYAPPQHPFGTVHQTKADAEAADR